MSASNQSTTLGQGIVSWARFVLLQGMLGFGICFAILFSLWQWTVFEEYRSAIYSFPRILMLSLPMGAIWGMFVWPFSYYSGRPSTTEGRRRYVARWKTTRASGAWQYVILRGILGFGLGVATLMSAISWHYDRLSLSMSDVAIRLPAQIVGAGLLIGWMSWWFSEMKYRRFASQVESSEAS